MRPPDDASFLCSLNSTAWKILGTVLKVRRLIGKRHTMHVHEQGMGVTITVCPAGQQESVPLPGKWLSPTGLLIWRAFSGPGEWLVGKEIAARIDRDHDTKLRYLLLDMEERGVLLHEDGKGYARATPLPPQDDGQAGKQAC